jgi:hypothetical protein
VIATVVETVEGRTSTWGEHSCLPEATAMPTMEMAFFCDGGKRWILTERLSVPLPEFSHLSA